MATRIYPDHEPNEMIWEVVRSEYIIKRPWMTARKDHLIMPSGNDCPEWYVLEFPEWINVIAQTKDGDFIMERQYRPGLKRYDWEIPAGVAEEGETLLQAAKRELFEETGYGNGEWKEMMVTCANPTNTSNLCHTFLATNVERLSAPQQETSEDISVWLMPKKELLEVLKSGGVVQSLMAAPLWRMFYDEKGSKKNE